MLLKKSKIYGSALTIKALCELELGIYDVRGRLVKTLLRAEVFPAGRHVMQWNGRDNGGASVASGVYSLKLISDGVTHVQRMTLLK